MHKDVRRPVDLRMRLGRRWAQVAALGATGGAMAFLLARVAPDISNKPLFEDEAVAGLIGARPVREIVVTILWDRGGAPVHFLLVHATFFFDASPAALRWLSVVFALAAIAVCYDLGRRLGGRVAGVAAAFVAVGSGMLEIYASFGRMYSLFAFAGALAADLLVRALHERTTGSAAGAAAAAWLLPAVHPYGAVVVAVEGVIALAVWRGRPLRAALPVGAIALACLPFAIADLRLAGRFKVGAAGERRVATPGAAWNQLESAVRGFAGGEGATLIILLALAAAGIVLLVRREPAFVAFAFLALVAPSVLSILVPKSGPPPVLSPRHLIYALPIWAAFIGVAVARATRTRALPWKFGALTCVATLAMLSPQGIADPRELTYVAPLGAHEFVAAPSDWLRERVQEGDLLYPYSSVFLAALPEAGKARGLPRAETRALVDTVRRATFPVENLFVAIPIGPATVRVDLVRARLGPRFEIGDFEAWLLVRAEGPFRGPVAALVAAGSVLAITKPALAGVVSEDLDGWLDFNEDVICRSLAKMGHAGCPRAP